MPSTKVVCRCSRCIKLVYTRLDGTSAKGQRLSRSTKSEHHKRDERESVQSTYTQQHYPDSPPFHHPPPTSSVLESQLEVPDLALAVQPVVKLCYTLALWLALCTGLSRANANKFLQALALILRTTLQIIIGVLGRLHFRLSEQSQIKISKDIRTVYTRYNLEPIITRTICCPKCFHLYSSVAPANCTWKRANSKRTQCKEPLWTQVRTRTNGFKRVPVCHYYTQDFDSWLQFFLGRSTIEDALHQTFTHSRAVPAMMHDIHDSPAWRAMSNFRRSPYHLVWGFYIDWFNPLSNKIAGKVISCGALIMYCLNLPIAIRYLPENTFLVGLTPGPTAPSTWTLSNIIESIIAIILRWDLPGRNIQTSRHPIHGVLSASRISPVIADLQASKKLTGYLSHSATLFCSWCLLTLGDIEDLDAASWTYREPETVRQQAREWKKLKTITAKNALSRETGVRYSPLHDVEYWNPVRDVILGPMHNWGGILEFQLRNLWGIGRNKAATQSLAADFDDDNSEKFSEADIEESVSELEELEQEQEEFDRQASTGLTDDLQGVDLSAGENNEMEIDREDSQTPMPVDPENEDTDPLTQEPAANVPVFDFTQDELEQIRSCIRNVLLPTSWIDRPPTNLGETKHGKLKVHEYFVLFSYILPLVLPELWWTPGAPEVEGMKLLESFVDIVSATNIVYAYSTSNAAADEFTETYAHYRRSIQTLFPAYSSVPNHHYAMHNGAMLKWWGPLELLSEKAGERQNGTLARIPTNRKRYQMELSMLRQSTRRSRLEAILHDKLDSDHSSLQLSNILMENDVFDILKDPPASDTPEAVREVRIHSQFLSDVHYDWLMDYFHSIGQVYRRKDAYPHPPGAMVLSGSAYKLHEIEVHGRLYSCTTSHPGASHIKFQIPSDTSRNSTGTIDEIWRMVIQDKIETFLLVQIHRQLPPSLARRAPYLTQSRLRCQIVDAAPSGFFRIIQPSHIITHLVAIHRPKGTYKIPRETVVINTSPEIRGWWARD